MKKQLNIFYHDLQPPKSSIQEVLFTLITNGSASIVDYRFLSGFRTRISNIKNEF